MDSNYKEIVDPLGEAVKQYFGLSYLFPYQRLIISNLLEAVGSAASGKLDNEDDRTSLGKQIVILPTGAGKSLCFQLPAILLDGPTLIIYPILSLMADQERRLAEQGFTPVVIRGGQSIEERNAVWNKLYSGQSKIIIANPEVLLNPKVLERLVELRIVHTVIDEAHCVSEWGESFRPSYLKLNTILTAINAPLVTAFTATASAPVLEKIEKYIFAGEGAARIIGNPDRPNIEYRAVPCMLRNLAVRDLLLANKRPAIVFCSSRSGTEHLARYLQNRYANIALNWSKEIRFYHAGLNREEKKELEKWYLRNTEAVLVATCAFGLGVDKADIRTVIHRDCPPSVEAYLQESGRAGRDGKQSRAILLWGPEDDQRLLRCKTKEENTRLNQLFNYARDINSCRREMLLRLLNYRENNDMENSDKPEENCCDTCSGESSTELREEDSIVNFFRRNRLSYTLEEASLILSNSPVVPSSIAVPSSTAVHWSKEESAELTRILLKKGTLTQSKSPFWKDKLLVTAKKRNRL